MAEDLVHDMYLRLADLIDDDRIDFADGEVNEYYVWRALRSVVVDHQRKQREQPTDFSYVETIDADQVDDMDVSGYHDTQNAVFHRVNLWLKTSLESHEKIVGDISNEDLQYVIYHEMRRWHWYDKAMFDLYFSTEMSYRDISKETGISVTNIHTTINNGKERIRQAVEKSGLGRHD